jgi:hypothetical protein
LEEGETMRCQQVGLVELELELDGPIREATTLA